MSSEALLRCFCVKFALQSITMGIALPKWLFDDNSRLAPLLLAVLLVF